MTKSTYGARRRKFVCLYDYDSAAMGRGGHTEHQLNFRKGDVITVIGDVDVNGYFTAELHGKFLLS